MKSFSIELHPRFIADWTNRPTLSNDPILCFSVNLNLMPAMLSWYVTMLWIIYEYSLAGAWKSLRALVCWKKWEIYARLGTLVDSGKSLTKILHLKIKLNRLSRRKQSLWSQRRSVFVFALIKFSIHHQHWLRTCFYCILKHSLPSTRNPQHVVWY